MSKLKLLFALPILAVALMGAQCQKLTDVVTQTCDGLQVAYEHYDAIKETGALSARVIRDVDLARQQTDRVCTNPAGASTVTLAAAAARSYVALKAAFAQGGDMSSAKLGYAKIEGLRSALEKARR